MDPPKLNLEVNAALDNTVQKRDERITEKQEKIAASLAGIGKTIELVLKSNPANKKEYLEPLTGVVRLLADLQYDETSIRRSLILKNIKAFTSEVCQKDPPKEHWSNQERRLIQDQIKSLLEKGMIQACQTEPKQFI